MPRAAEYSSDDEMPMLGGDVGAAGLPFDLSEDESERIYNELLEREQQRKQRPVGFAPWPEP